MEADFIVLRSCVFNKYVNPNNRAASFNETIISISIATHLVGSSSTAKLKHSVEEFSILKSFSVPIHPQPTVD